MQERQRQSEHDSAAVPSARRPSPPVEEPHALLDLQQQIGNAAVVRRLERGPERDAGPEPTAVPDVLRGPGRPLDGPVRADMESHLGADFGDVRVHTGPAAQRSAAEIGARAYTCGTNVVLGEGGGDAHTLAHELTHVIQQRNGPVAGTDTGTGLRISDPSDRFEREAEDTATRVTSGRPADRPAGGPPLAEAATTRPPAAVQRMEAGTSTGPGTAAGGGAAEVRQIVEGEIGAVGPGGILEYPEVTSCLTVTVRLRGGGMIGAHISLRRMGEGLRSDTILPALREQVNQQKKGLFSRARVHSIDVRGVLDIWNPSYLTRSMSAHSEAGEQIPGPERNIEAGLRETIAGILGRDAAKITVTHEEGLIRVTDTAVGTS